MPKKNTMNRREFLGSMAVASTITVVPRYVLGGPGYVAPSDKINLALIGSGTMGLNMLVDPWLPSEDLHISCICDPNTDSTDYRDWSRHGIRDHIRKFLEMPNWGAGDAGIRGGREVGKSVIETYYGKKYRSGNYDGCRPYADFRELLEKETTIDGVLIMTPDHLHATIAIAAMNKGKHAVSHKTLSNVLHEVRLAADTARRKKVTTHLLAWQNDPSMYQIRDWLKAGAIGTVREIHNWSNRPVWPQGWLERPEEQRVPAGMDWDLWLGPVPHRPYNLNYTHALFRGWYDFGAGCLGDMGNYSLWKVYRILGLTAPVSVEATTSSDARVIEGVSEPVRTKVAFPHASAVRFRHPAIAGRAAVDVFWYDGGIKPPTPPELYDSKEELSAEGMMLVGDDGKILAEFGGDNPRLIPESKMRELGGADKAMSDDLASGHEEWVRAIKSGKQSRGSFEEVQTLAEATCLANIAIRMNRRLDWNTTDMTITNLPEANQFLGREYRQGWELPRPVAK
jgi:predicted dehydrogenase